MKAIDKKKTLKWITAVTNLDSSNIIMLGSKTYQYIGVQYHMTDQFSRTLVIVAELTDKGLVYKILSGKDLEKEVVIL